jgi:hypothetical protein
MDWERTSLMNVAETDIPFGTIARSLSESNFTLLDQPKRGLRKPHSGRDIASLNSRFSELDNGRRSSPRFRSASRIRGVAS